MPPGKLEVVCNETVLVGLILIGDNRNLNGQTIPGLYPTLSFQGLLHRVSGASIFSKIDLVKACHQIPLAPAARKKTAIIFFKYNPMPFCFRNASATFHGFIHVYVMACLSFWLMFTTLFFYEETSAQATSAPAFLKIK